VSRLMPGFGAAGWACFTAPAPSVHTLAAGSDDCGRCATAAPAVPLVHNVPVDEFTHSDAFIGTGYAERYWLPFFLDLPGDELADFYEACARAKRLEEERDWPELERHERAFRERRWRLWGPAGGAPAALAEYIREYLACRARLLHSAPPPATREDWVDRATRLTWLAVADARVERARPPAERDAGRLRAAHPVQAVGRAVDAVMADRA